VVREDSERICSVLRFDGNKPLYVLHKSVGPVQYRERCMLSDRPSLKLPVPHLSVGPVQYRERCMLSDRPSLKLPVPHLGQVDIFKKMKQQTQCYL